MNLQDHNAVFNWKEIVKFSMLLDLTFNLSFIAKFKGHQCI